MIEKNVGGEFVMTKREIRRCRRKRQQQVFIILQVCCICLIVVLAANIIHRLGQLEEAIPAMQIEENNERVDQIQNLSEAEAISAEKELVQSGEAGNISTYARQCEVDTVETPEKRGKAEILDKLAELAEESEMIASIYGDWKNYPDKLLEALANNPEMADFAKGYPGRQKQAELTDEEKNMEYPLFLQWDPRWGYEYYGDDSNVGLAGCGPTALSMVLFYLTRDEHLTPNVIAEYAMEYDYYMYGTGTLWALMEEVPGRYGVSVHQSQISEEQMQQELEEGHVMICAMRPGDFTAAGHFIVIYGYDENGFLVNDPNCVARSRESWPFSRIRSQIKQLWSFDL